LLPIYFMLGTPFKTRRNILATVSPRPQHPVLSEPGDAMAGGDLIPALNSFIGGGGWGGGKKKTSAFGGISTALAALAAYPLT